MGLPYLSRHEPAFAELRGGRHLRSIHPATDRDGAADRRSRSCWAGFFSAVADSALTAGGFPDDQRAGHIAGRDPRYHGERGRRAVGTPVRAYRRHH